MGITQPLFFILLFDSFHTAQQGGTLCNCTLPKCTAASPYIISTAPILSIDPSNLLECTPDGLFAPATKFEVLDTSCIDLNISGNGTDASPYTLSSSLVISGATTNLITCTSNGLELLCEEVQDCVGAGFTAGLMYDDSTNTFKAHFSGDAKNIIGLGSDGGLFVPSVHVEGLGDSCISVEISGCGTPDEPIIVDVSPIISDDDCNTLSCTPDGLFARKIVSFEIGQQCQLDAAGRTLLRRQRQHRQHRRHLRL